MSTPQKRPLGLRGRKQQQKNEDRQKKVRLNGEDNSFTVALAPSSASQADQTTDGLTLEDLLQLKTQADELIDNPSGLDEDDDQLVNLLRGICHEAIRQIELAEKEEAEEEKETTRRASSYLLSLSHQLLGWASLELGIFLTLHQQSDRFVQDNEPKSLDAWLSIASKIFENRPPSEKNPEGKSQTLADLELLIPRSICLLKAEEPSEIAQILLDFDCPTWNREQSVYLLRTIDRIILFKYEAISQDPTPIFRIIIKLLEGILNKNDTEGDDGKTFQRLLDQRLGDCYLAHGSLLAEKLEEKYYPEQDEEQTTEEEEFAIDVQDPTYILSLENLRLADRIFSKLIEDMDETSESKAELKTKLDETLLTIGNLLPPGSEREELYLRAGLSGDNDDGNGGDDK
ncbi:hypothetical protein PTTG_08727 [Puccinia triticina 1-1 BBBD Race 1]|uniref:Uncharacterized protein n=2 Tax=Puccinia triticina TaxID=208348 RepID=A0A0C4F6G0_PUCT1|nr:uncharacterized protein PtA15_13A42 [Puccinia triticina]OAV93330.1 hypothetical protein PTTG_08727 [Puccinia triticina 1-1 BBBD Race 1]WAQ90643.1 hypothetical protein PtA15_13A42 [Puccinia triticina]